jgi:hypothetical protein
MVDLQNVISDVRANMTALSKRYSDKDIAYVILENPELTAIDLETVLNNLNLFYQKIDDLGPYEYLGTKQERITHYDKRQEIEQLRAKVPKKIRLRFAV